MILKFGGNPFMVDYNGMGLGHFCVEQKNVSMLVHLVSKYPEILFQRDKCGLYPIHYSAFDAECKMIDVMLDFQRQMNKRDTKAIDMFLFRDSNGLTPLHWASSLGNLAVCKKIIAYSTKTLNSKDLEGETPIFKAFRSNRVECLQFFCSLQIIDKTIKNYKGEAIQPPATKFFTEFNTFSQLLIKN
ncbi:hypothetical protein DICPUDRAFT_91789 [Dictyostelium purpureum]|uniref:Uncharacterized protein n=1 Tax=Dictyostelium purpureum TaxID=5786 RepID=F0ZH52_DICPU|nr:uncharacterized protein DICPUDRAFT_91789 [Dictyostelium purpureum]EGC36733.1 hypothetical protein DICPUDRAFT_91789 [Dictyostelium purpureum]|eukprot:XP_003286758.1 hypothetical protein DICPUDRAFT_91789 [Dictyostelium purpureum]